MKSRASNGVLAAASRAVSAGRLPFLLDQPQHRSMVEILGADVVRPRVRRHDHRRDPEPVPVIALRPLVQVLLALDQAREQRPQQPLRRGTAADRAPSFHVVGKAGHARTSSPCPRRPRPPRCPRGRPRCRRGPATASSGRWSRSRRTARRPAAGGLPPDDPAQPRGLQPGRPVHRGIRRSPAPATGQPARGLRARWHAGVRRPAVGGRALAGAPGRHARRRLGGVQEYVRDAAVAGQQAAGRCRRRRLRRGRR